MNYKKKITLSVILIFIIIIQLLMPGIYVYAESKGNDLIFTEVEESIKEENDYYLIEHDKKEINLKVGLKEDLTKDIISYEAEFEYDSNKIINIEKTIEEDKFTLENDDLSYKIKSDSKNIVSIKLLLKEELKLGEIFSFTINNIKVIKDNDECLLNDDIVLNFKVKEELKNNEVNKLEINSNGISNNETNNNEIKEIKENILNENSSTVKENLYIS